MSNVIVAPEIRDLTDLARDLSACLGKRLPGASRTSKSRTLLIRAGAGQSHETILFDLRYTQDGQERARGCVVRIRPEKFTVFPDNLFEQQYRIDEGAA